MSKSLGNFYKLSDVEKKGFDPLALRYLFLTAHYRTQMNFTWESLGGAANAYKLLLQQVAFIKSRLLEKKVECMYEVGRVCHPVKESQAAIFLPDTKKTPYK
jgi:cysteinyl-tRNA synthetase